MAYGKGSFNNQDKILPGAYVNVKGEAEVGSVIGSRGKVAVALNLDWGNDTGGIFKVTAKEFYTQCIKVFGYAFSDDKMLTLREIFKGANEVYVYRLNATNGVKASISNFATAKYAGDRGNAIKVTTTANIDASGKFDVVTVLGDVVVDRQIAVTAETVKDNDYITFLKGTGFTLTAGTKTLSGGSNGTAGATAQHTDFLTKLEAYQVNVVGCVDKTEGVAPIYASWVKSQRDTYGNRIQAVLYDQAADHEGIINVDESIDLVPWVMGKSAGCPLNESLQNTVYDGEVAPTKNYTQADLEVAIQAGKFVLHRVGDEFRVLADINSLITITGDKTEDFKLNQTIRVVDQIDVDVCNTWNNDFLGKVPNTNSGRVGFWARIIALLKEYYTLGAIEEYDTELVTVEEGTQRGAVVVQIPVTVATMLEKAYITIVVQ